ncbi:RING-finger DEAD-like helicase PHD and SNF2 domain-containing protein [Citrus sinensis]|uniref:RING-finger DEAD-like helicase PHD and SNF2 domain-containing protein n=1 Tax=Citrus sinensis TaxID=2711 RepID=A0ACB8L2D1_CITSI|nr:RING-finger DEAD-like helicase PHD and SNF2 domain-containing protein [Citrus sinensis]
MGRRKQSRPHRSGGVTLENNNTTESESNKQKPHGSEQPEKEELADVDHPFFVEVNRTCWLLDEHLDISEIVLTDLKLREEFYGSIISEDFYQVSRYTLRLHVCHVNEFIGRIKLGHWPLLSSNDVTLEFVEKCMEEEMETCKIMLSGSFDAPDEGITGLVHLASMEFLTLRPTLGITFSEDMSSLRVRVEILKSAFDACESLLENSRKTWKKSMINVMSWLRPEVLTSEARYGVSKSMEMDVELMTRTKNDVSASQKHASFDVARFYEAIKRSKAEPMLEEDLPDLLPLLRPYQRRAAYWMVQREKGDSANSSERERSQFFSPLCMPMDFLDTYSTLFYNPFSGSLSLSPDYTSSYVFGGILADEMGLGKTVELLACIFAHRKPASDDSIFIDTAVQVTDDQKVNLRRLKRERVECICGAVSESRKYKGLWVQCDICDAWQHANCVGYSPRGKKRRSTFKLKKHTRKKDMTNIVVRDGEHICQWCDELIEATDSPVATGATLIVCPAPILAQWDAEITRHTRPGSLKTCIYEGARNSSLSDTSIMDISELVSADIVLTTYDVLKEDLSHDSDRHEGDRRFMRFQKRYPVIPTLLTRIFWWRICLDEAQMVESNAAAATEMALRLYAKHRWCITGTPIQRKLDDLYGLLRFLKSSPFSISRWWIEVIRDPYENGDVGAMEFTHKFFKEIMCRSSKVHVSDELQLPPQEECVSWLTFSPIEEHFYQSQHETCVGYAREVIQRLKDNILKRNVPGHASSDALYNPIITHAEAAKLLNSLLKLRQACCHPQVGSSGLRSLQQSPLSMDEILMVLIGKTKIEGEEALRKLVMALNGLAGIALIEKNLSQAVSLYKEAMAVVEEHSEDFRLDPLLNIHLHHNLTEILPMVANCATELSQNEQHFPGSSEKAFKIHSIETCDENARKCQRVSREENSDFTDAEDPSGHLSDLSENGFNGDRKSDCCVSSSSFDDASLITVCENLKQKYLSGFSIKLSVAQQEFRKSYVQVCNALDDREKQYSAWWLEALHHAEGNKDFSAELIRKIEEAISGSLNKSRALRTASRLYISISRLMLILLLREDAFLLIVLKYRSISGLKYHIQSSLDQLEASRKTLLDRLLEIDQTMEKPKEEDMDRMRHCRICYGVGDGPICVHCELDESFQDYEARLFRLKKSQGDIASAEEAVDLQKKNSSLNRFYWYLSQPNKNSTSSSVGNEEIKRRDVRETVVVSKSPSELEVILGVIKNYCKTQLGREAISASSKQLHILEAMRKEYAYARSLATAQAQFLRAHDEIRMATTRLHLKEDDNDTSVDALSPDELASASVTNSSEKFISMTLLSQVKGKLRYLKTFSVSQLSEGFSLLYLIMPLMDFLFDFFFPQRTDIGNIAYADDRQDKSCNYDMPHGVQDCEKGEESFTVQGSYGTKIEAVTRRILWIKSTDPKAKILVFSSWNDVLDVLEHAFIANNITCIKMKGGRKSQVAISKFTAQKRSAERTDKTHAQQPEPKPIQVLLLLIQHGANGLNLLEAEHVVLVEPLLNPAAEAQAISRVHRIGQENRTLVHRFIVKNTVEESIYKLNRGRNTSSFISGNTKNQDQPLLRLKDIESLFASGPSTIPESDEKPTDTESLRHLPPSVAAATAAEKRFKEHREQAQ